VFYFGFFIIMLPLTSILEQIAATEMINNYWVAHEKEVERLYRKWVAEKRRLAWQKVRKAIRKDLEWLSSSATPKRRSLSTISENE
jgi:hypothetical protein